MITLIVVADPATRPELDFFSGHLQEVNPGMRKYYLIDHRFLFAVGLFFYLGVPFLAGENGWFAGFPGMDLYHEYFRQIPEDQLWRYGLICSGWLLAFFAGHWCFCFFRPPKRPLQLFPQSLVSWGISYLGIVFCLLLLMVAWSGRGSLFGGYASYNVGLRGKMSTLLVLCNFFLLYQLITAQRKSFFLIVCTVLTAFLLLTMGGRLYVFQTLIAYAIFKTSFSDRPWHPRQIITFGIAAFFLGTLSGIWRLKASFSFDRAIYSLMAEPMFTWFSTSTYLASNEIPLFSIPFNHITSFYNLVPNSVISLRPYIVSTYSMVKNYQSPLGADSIWSTVVINFGSLGSCLFLFCTGFLLHFLRSLSERYRFAAVYYICFCAMLPFQFFRDGFYIQHKQLLVNFLFFPGLLLIVLQTMFYLMDRRRLSL